MPATSNTKKTLITITTIIAIAAVGFIAKEYTATPTTRVAEEQTYVVLKTVSPQEFKQLMEQTQDKVIIDVRTPEEYAQEHIAGAINIDFYAPDFREKLAQLDKNKTYFIYCRSGNRSGQTLQIMKELGFKKVYNLEGGITAWKSAGYEVVR